MRIPSRGPAQSLRQKLSAESRRQSGMGMPGIQNGAELNQCRLLKFVCDATLLVIVFFSLQSLLQRFT